MIESQTARAQFSASRLPRNCGDVSRQDKFLAQASNKGRNSLVSHVFSIAREPDQAVSVADDAFPFAILTSIECAFPSFERVMSPCGRTTPSTVTRMSVS